MALHCSFEHFEGRSDIGFIREAERVLRPGGAVCVVPLYLSEEYAIQTDPDVAAPAGVVFEDDATVYCARYQITNAAQVGPSCYVRFALLMQKLDPRSGRPGVPGA